MRKFFLTTSLLASISLSSIGQKLDSTASIQNFIKVWGFLKYYHPLIATGTIDWDSVFVNHVQKVINAKNRSEFNSEILSIINSVGKPSKVESSKLPDSLFVMNKAPINWINDSKIFDNKIKSELRYIYENKNKHTNRYIKMDYETTDFSGEKRYDSMSFPNLEYRLLFLSRFWNIITYYAPYKYLTTNWDSVLQKFIPKVISATDTIVYYKTLQELCKSLNDGHAQLTLLSGQIQGYDVIFGGYTVPFYCEIINEKVIVRNVPNDSISKAINIKQGDIILKMDDRLIRQIISDKRKYISASNYADEMHQLSNYILDGQTQTVTLEIQRANKIIKTTVKRIPVAQRDWRRFINYTGNNVGYKKINDSTLLIYAAQIWGGNLETIKHLIKNSRAVIFDVRNYPRNDAFYSITDPFLSEPKTIDYSTIALPAYPSLFKWKLNLNKVGHFSDSAYKGKVIILCDERTESQGEYSCMVLQTIPQAVTIGSQTAGADGVNRMIPMGGGLNVSYSCYGVYYLDKTQTQRVGIKINIPVKKTVKAIKEGKDEILERALEYIKTGK
jgi:C-terminal processing protease CtpA/Prc